MGAKPGHTRDESMLIQISYGERKDIHRASFLFYDCEHDPTLGPSGMCEFGLAALTGLIWLLAVIETMVGLETAERIHWALIVSLIVLWRVCLSLGVCPGLL